MFFSLRGLRKRVARRDRKPRFSRPTVERLEERALLSITFSGTGNTGDVTVTGTDQTDRFVVRLDPADATMIQLSDDGGATFTSAALTDVTSITVNGLGGNDRLTIDNSNGLVASTAGVQITFDGGTGVDALRLVGDPGVANVSETYTVGSTAGTGTLESTDGTVSQTIDFSDLSVIFDTTVADSLTINLNDNANLVLLQEGPTINQAKTLRVTGVDGQSMDGAPDVKMDDQTGGDTGVDGDLAGQPEANLFANPRDAANQSFPPILLANKTNVTLNTLGGGDFVLLNHPNGVAGLNTLTIDGGADQDTVALKHPPAGATVTTVNVEKTVTKSKDLFLQELFELRLERPATDADLAFWSNALDRAGTLAVVQAIDNSAEAHAVQVKHLYQHYLGRAADANGLGYFVSLLNRGAHEESIIASLLGSQEFLNKAEADFPGVSPNEAFVRELYQFALNRTATASEVSFWVQQLPTNATSADRTKVAIQFLFSREFRSDVIMALYSDLLRRQSDKGGISFFTAVGGDLRRLRETFLASQEFMVNN